MNEELQPHQTRRGKRWIVGTLLYLTLSGVAAYYVIGYTTLYRRERATYAERYDFKQRLLDMDEWLGESPGPAGGDQLLDRALTYYQYALVAAAGLAMLSLLYLLLCWRMPAYWVRGGALVAAALVCLVTGLFTPMMEIAAFERNLEIPLQFDTGLFSIKVDYTQVFEGDLYFYYQSKSIVELIALLFRQHNFTVGGSILLFSVLIPLSKLLLGGAVLVRPSIWQNKFARFVLAKTGKWSMADVFVVALFLGYLAFSNMQAGIQTQSNVLVGLYFFLAYCLIAIVLSGYLPERPTEVSAVDLDWKNS